MLVPSCTNNQEQTTIGSPRTWFILQHLSALFMTSLTQMAVLAVGRRAFVTFKRRFLTHGTRNRLKSCWLWVSIYSTPIDKNPWCLFGWVGSPLIKYGDGTHGGLRTPLAQGKEPIAGEGRAPWLMRAGYSVADKTRFRGYLVSSSILLSRLSQSRVTVGRITFFFLFFFLFFYTSSNHKSPNRRFA